MLKIDGTTTVKEVLINHPGVISFFIRRKMLCVGCPAEMFHTIKDVANNYGLLLEELLKDIQEVIDAQPD